MNQLNVVTLATAKLWLRIDDGDTSNDSTIEALIKAAVNQVEQYTLQILWQRTFTSKTSTLGKYRIFEYPLVSIESLVNTDSEDVEYDTTVTDWYTEILSDDDGIQTVSFVAGYGWTYTLGSEVPEDIITAIKEMIAYWYENRENAKQGMPVAATFLLGPYRRVTLF